MTACRWFASLCRRQSVLMTTIPFGYLLFFIAMQPVAQGDTTRSGDDTKKVVSHTNGHEGRLNDARPVAQLVRVPLPITGNVERRLISQIRSTIKRLKKAPQKTMNGQHSFLSLTRKMPCKGRGASLKTA